MTPSNCHGLRQKNSSPLWGKVNRALTILNALTSLCLLSPPPIAADTIGSFDKFAFPRLKQAEYELVYAGVDHEGVICSQMLPLTQSHQIQSPETYAADKRKLIDTARSLAQSGDQWQSILAPLRERIATCIQSTVPADTIVFDRRRLIVGTVPNLDDNLTGCTAQFQISNTNIPDNPHHPGVAPRPIDRLGYIDLHRVYAALFPVRIQELHRSYPYATTEFEPVLDSIAKPFRRSSAQIPHLQQWVKNFEPGLLDTHKFPLLMWVAAIAANLFPFTVTAGKRWHQIITLPPVPSPEAAAHKNV